MDHANASATDGSGRLALLSTSASDLGRISGLPAVGLDGWRAMSTAA
jgi:hypothetical protein